MKFEPQILVLMIKDVFSQVIIMQVHLEPKPLNQVRVVSGHGNKRQVLLTFCCLNQTQLVQAVIDAHWLESASHIQ